MRRWNTATKGHEDILTLSSKLKGFHGMLQRAAMRFYDGQDMRKATETALKGYGLISIITSSDAALGQALHAHAPALAQYVRGARLAVVACRFSITGADQKSLKSFADDLADAQETLAFSGVFNILIKMDKQTEVCTHFLSCEDVALAG